MFTEELTVIKLRDRNRGARMMWCVMTNNSETAALFGTNILPTPFSASMPVDEVLGRIQKLNPDSIVKAA